MKASNKLILALIIINFFPAISATGVFKNVWIDRSAQHDVTLSVMDGESEGETSSILLKGGGNLNSKRDWVISDSVKNCPQDADISIYPNSFELVDLLKNNDYYVLLSYRISCSGGVDPGEVKYFAYNNGKKYSLRGQETIKADGSKMGGEGNVIADENLNNNLPLLNYMKGKWDLISTTAFN
ncbi:conserved hypothetical protein [Enterobacterales bacterium 8AC]|nr:conserved hypothetical protein [Enterobacterales bacterium 8AC]